MRPEGSRPTWKAEPRSAAGAGAPPRATTHQSAFLSHLSGLVARPCHAVTNWAQPRGGRAGCLPALGTGGNPNTAHAPGSVPLQWQLSHPHHGAGTGASCSYWTQISLQKYFLHNLGKSNSRPAISTPNLLAQEMGPQELKGRRGSRGKRVTPARPGSCRHGATSAMRSLALAAPARAQVTQRTRMKASPGQGGQGNPQEQRGSQAASGRPDVVGTRPVLIL